jgi:flagellum-specific peptidoglycan hydrolase FlgJ
MMQHRTLLLLKQKARATWYRIKLDWKSWSWKVAIFLAFVYFINEHGFHFQLSIGGKNVGKTNTENPYSETKIDQASGDIPNPATAIGAGLTVAQQKEAQKYNNLSIVFNAHLAQKLDPKVFDYKKQKCLDYIQKFLATAKEEARLYNIPVSIKLAQGLLETNAGESSLAQKENNHFGIKCKNKCIGCRCANYSDDDRYDMFRIFDSPWTSFREHSKLLQQPRYQHLLKLDRSDYKSWAHGLKQAGYATDKKYAEKLIEIIEYFKLHKHDQ